MRLFPAGPDGVIYGFVMEDGSQARIYAGWSPTGMASGRWSERRQGLETVRWRASENGRIDYYIDRPWAESAGIPRRLHAWVEASENGEISGAESLILTLRSCDPRMCPPPAAALVEPNGGGGSPEPAPVVANAAEPEAETTPETDSAEAVETETTIEPLPRPEPEPVAEVASEIDETSPLGTEQVPPVAESVSESAETAAEAEPIIPEPEPGDEPVIPEAVPDNVTEPESAEDEATEPEDAAEEPRQRRGPVVLTGNGGMHP
ncbi:hypothetical protein [Hyphobacterium sp.]|uniref:hypothetical protein n=1 Tax=Hyphobacterium sp. TaxID=2004662 RepID=UPI003BAB9B3D